MRRATHHRTIALTALALLLAGCGTQGGSDAGGSGTVSPSPTRTHQGCTTAKAELGAADTGHTYCLATGDVLRILLDGTTGRPWAPVTVSGSALRATNSGIVIQPGDAVAAFEAVSAGTARLSSSRPLCATEPGRVSCKGLQDWTVTVRVTKP
ncbi:MULTISPECIES: hypothetical protein [Streptomyces]|uniref:Proteinase inhibitor I42 chagasin domain-containing protein n=1 Tax=Streptomyces dengpaensis TaxID=2049881 RepID=A0ABN5HZY3_9ACTN|nr:MULTISPECIES: hypothetical protein [Streptomyces]AVH56604.1 hypothetical protein C4B68_13410 [Streptomyces dengpaensis]PIB10371.1 hypothetical protein B1C81_07720 [Streptomyces sp. HG99]